jgi:acetyl-CoA synthetase
MLACARIGATHSIIFGGFSADAIADRINDAQAKVVVTADGGFRRGKVLPLKPAVDEALEKCPSSRTSSSCAPAKNDVDMSPAATYWWHDLMADASPT